MEVTKWYYTYFIGIVLSIAFFLLMPLWHMDGTCDATMMVLENPDVTKCIVNDQEFLHGKPIQIFLIWPIRPFVNYVFHLSEYCLITN